RIVARDAPKLVAFLKSVFRATGEVHQDRPSEIEIGDSLIMISEADVRDVTTAFLYVYVDDVDATHARALKAGAEEIEEPADQPYGDRRSMAKDAWGNLWQIAKRLGK